MDNLDDLPWLKPRAAYLHIPFCAHHCGYCDFAVSTGQDDQIEFYLDALEVELASLQQPQMMKTIFLGGGTPTYLNSKQLERLLNLINQWLPLGQDGEWSIESTPESITEEKTALLKDHGVTRISVGVQSFHAHLLPALDRIHQPEHVAPAVTAARKAGLALSLDLIFGIPGQTIDEWRADLSTALAINPDHISTYGLTYEKGTPLWKDRERGAVKALDEDTELAMYELAMDHLERAGFEHYEISNFANPGQRCRHNEVYWANHAYHGFGLGAARYVDGKREVNVRNLKDYLKRVLTGESATFQSEELNPEERARETAVIQIRRSDGICRESFRHQTGYSVDTLLAAKIRHQVELGILDDDGESVRLTRSGKCVADAIARDWL